MQGRKAGGKSPVEKVGREKERDMLRHFIQDGNNY